MKRKIGIIGAGKQAGESVRLVRGYLEAEVVFYSDDYGGEGKKIVNTPHINLKDIGSYVDKDTKLLSAVGDPGLKKKMIGSLSRKRFTNCICSKINETIILGDDVTIAPGCNLTENINIGSHVLINIGCNINHNVEIGDFTTISPGVNIAGHCHIGKEVFIGIGVTIVDRITIEDGAIIGAGAVVTKNVGYNQIVAGVPAKIIGRKNEKDPIFKS
jgi:sugar O-acyltransferase (sialic acid O-acetyltransferase NeuD family)